MYLIVESIIVSRRKARVIQMVGVMKPLKAIANLTDPILLYEVQ